MQMYVSKKVLQNYGIEELGTYNSKNIMVFQNDIEDAVMNNEMMAIIGKPGTGKSVLFQRVKNKFRKDVQFCYIKNYHKESIGAGSIIEAVFDELKIGESLKRSLEARSRQFVRNVGERHVREGAKICIVIEEAHRLHIDFLRTLKEMREAEFAGVSPLFSVMLIGHPLLIHKLKQRNETNWRTRTLYLTEANGWFDFDERVKYLEVKYGAKAITIEARRRIATHCKLPLEMDDFVRGRMEEGIKAGKKILDNDVVQPDVQEYWDTIHAENPGQVSYRKVAKLMNVSPGTVSQILAGKGTKKKETELIKSLRKISDENKDNRIDKREAV